jgi:hypothetical protein
MESGFPPVHVSPAVTKGPSTKFRVFRDFRG